MNTISRKSYYDLLVISISTLLFSIVTLGFSSYIFSISKEIDVEEDFEYVYRPLPSKYLIDESVMSPTLDQGPRGTCYLFQIIAILESQYKQQALQYGYLEKDQYLRFSHEGLAYKMVQRCLEQPNSFPCFDSPRRLNTTEAGSLTEFINFYKEWDDFKHWVVPANCCKYQQLPENEMICPDIEQCIKNNPIEFEILKHYVTVNIEDIKQTLHETKLPLAFSITLPQQRYIFPCTNKLVKDSFSCKNHDFYCPTDPSKFCSIHDFKLFKISDTEFVFQKTGKTVPGTPHAMTLVGYNDNFSPKLNINFTHVPRSTGGFILKNSWGARGHTYEYLMGMITEDQDAVFCPDKDNVLRWVPADLECIKSKKSGDLCSTDARISRGKRIINHADTLKCVNVTHCDLNATYYLLRDSPTSLAASFVWSEEGVPLPRVIKVKDGYDPVIETIETLPIQHAYYAFQLRDDLQEKNIPGKCGYVMLPYDTVRDLRSVLGDQGSSYFITQGIKLRFTKSSFKASGARKDYKLVDRSLARYKELLTDDPLDLEELLQ